MSDPRGIETSGTMRPSNARALEGFLVNEERHRIYGFIRNKYEELGLNPAQYPSQSKRSRLLAAKCCLIVESAGRRLQTPPSANDPNDDQLNRREVTLIRKQLQSRYTELGLDPDSFTHVQRRFELDFIETFVTAEILVRFLRRVQATPVDGPHPPNHQEETQTTLENAMRECSAPVLTGLFENTAFEPLLRRIIREVIRPDADPGPGRSLEQARQLEPIIYFKKEAGKTWAWRGSDSPSTGQGEWIEQRFKQWPPSTPVDEPQQQSSSHTQ